MNFDSTSTIFLIGFPILFGIMALFFLVIGLRGILTKRPFLVSNRWLLLIMFAIFVPLTLQTLFFPPPGSFLVKWLNPSIFIVVLVMMCFALRGYVAYGVTDTSFRDGLLAGLQKLQLPYEESLSIVRLPSVEADLQVSVQAWMGAGQIKVKQRGHGSLLAEIISEMNEHFRMSSTPANLTTCIFFVIMGVIMITAGIGTVLLFQ